MFIIGDARQTAVSKKNSHRRWSRFAGACGVIFCGILLFGSSGCVALPLATIGTLLGGAGSAAVAGTEVYNLGKLDFSVMGTFDQCKAATLAAAGDLELRVVRSEAVGRRTNETSIELEDDLKKKITVSLDSRTGQLCQCRVDVGIFGSEPTAKLIMQRLRHHLPGGTSESREALLQF